MELPAATFVVFSAFMTCAHGVTITIYPQTVTLEKGHSFTLPCIISGSDFDLFDNPLIWYKETEIGYKQINTNAQINDPFQQTGRYSVEFKRGEQVQEGTAEIPLTVKDAKVGDSGIYKCEVGGKKGVIAEVTHKVTVTEPPEYVRLRANRSKLDSSNRTVIILEEGHPGQLDCQSRGGNPQPDMRIFIGTHDVSNDFDETVVSEPSQDAVGLQYSVHTVTLKSKRFGINTMYQREKITCVSSVPETEYSINDTAIIEVHYAPLIFCEKTYYANLGDLDFKLTCKVRAFPALTHALWSLGSINLTKTEYIEGFTSHITTFGENTIAELTISNITNASFTGYKLIAGNDISTVSRVIKVAEMESTTSRPTHPSTVAGLEITQQGAGGDKATPKPYHPPYELTGTSVIIAHNAGLVYTCLLTLLCFFRR